MSPTQRRLASDRLLGREGRPRRPRRSAERIVGLFLAFGTLWILVSDQVLSWLIKDPRRLSELQSIKGMVFVASSALLIYLLVKRAEHQQTALEADTTAQRDRLAHILDVTPAVTYSLRAQSDGSFMPDFIGHNIEALTGYPLDSWLNEPGFWRTHVHPDDLAAVDAAQRTLFERTQLSHEYRIRHAAGGHIWVHDNVVLVHDAAGQPAGIIGTWLDVTDRKLAELASAESEGRYRELFELNPLPMWVYDLATLRFVDANAAAVHKYGHSLQSFQTMDIRALHPPQEQARLQAQIDTIRQQAQPYSHSGEWQQLKQDGSPFWVEVSGHNFQRDGRRLRLVLAQDITDRRQAEDSLRLIAHVFQGSQEGIFITDASAHIISVNRSFTAITGYTEDEVRGHTPALLKSGLHDRLFYAAFWREVSTTGRWEGEIWNRRKTGELYPEWLSISAIRDGQGAVQQYLGIFTETSNRKAAEARIQRLANFDALTNLPNRALLTDRAQLALATADRKQGTVVVMHLNIDHFGAINESYGHDAGDRVLVTIAERLVHVLQPDDTVSRVGGDDFILLLPHTPPHDAAQLADRVMARISAPMSVEGHELRLSASIGIASFPDDGQDLAQLTQAAESAIRQAKRKGPNTCQFFSRDLQDQVKESLAMERELRHAVARAQLVLHYQPQVDAHTGRLIGCEALVRWQHPAWGLVPPGKFIPIAEGSDLIRDIGQWVMREAMRQNAAWLAEGLPAVPVAINLSVVQFRHPGLRDAVFEALQDSGLPAHLVELELTESVAMEDSDFTIATIDHLKRLGVQLSIDDFGTGYSSLSYLKRFAIDKLKIDRSFVMGVNEDADDAAIVTAVIGLARSLGLRTIAEGVETPAQLDFLRREGCDEIQGYLFGRPMPAADFAALLARPASSWVVT